MVYGCASPDAVVGAYAFEPGVVADRVFRGPDANVLAASFVGGGGAAGAFGIVRLIGASASSSSSSSVGRAALVSSSATSLEPGETVTMAAWQPVERGGASGGANAGASGPSDPFAVSVSSEAAFGGVAVLTDRRLILLEYADARTTPEAAASDPSSSSSSSRTLTRLAERRGDVSSFCWVGPALVYAHVDGLSVLGWDDVSVLVASAGVGGGGGALLTVTEDAAAAIRRAGRSDDHRSRRSGSGTSSNAPSPHAPPAPPAATYRPLALFDALTIGWGSLCASRRVRGLSQPRDARDAVTNAAGRHDASRVSSDALRRLSDDLRLPGLAANVAARATHLPPPSARARPRGHTARASPWRRRAPRGTHPRGPISSIPGGVRPRRGDADVAAAARTPRAPPPIGDARAAFDAAALAVAATAGRDLAPLTRLCERGVAATATNANADGGFASIERDVATRLAPGAIKDACVAALRKRRAPARAREIRGVPKPSGADARLGWMASAATAAERFESGPNGVVGDVGVPPREVSRAATITRADWVGRRFEGSGAGWAELDGDATEDARRGGEGLGLARGFSGGSWGSPTSGGVSPAGGVSSGGGGTAPGSAGFTFDAAAGAGTGTGPGVLPGAEIPETTRAATPAFTPAPPARGIVHHPDDDENENGDGNENYSDSDDGFDASSDEDGDASGGFGTRRGGKIKFQITPATTAAAAATFAIAPPGATPADVPRSRRRDGDLVDARPGAGDGDLVDAPASVPRRWRIRSALVSRRVRGGAAPPPPRPTRPRPHDRPRRERSLRRRRDDARRRSGRRSVRGRVRGRGRGGRRVHAQRDELGVDDPFGGGGMGRSKVGRSGRGVRAVVGDGSSSVTVATPVAFAGVGDGGR